MSILLQTLTDILDFLSYLAQLSDFGNLECVT